MIDCRAYVPTDKFFGAPFIDEDSEQSTPVPYRLVRGGFEGTATRFRFYFPPKDSGYEGRMFNPLSGAHGGVEDFFASPFGEAIGGLSACFRLGGYMIESNQGHIGDDVDPKGGDDPALYGFRASAEVARFSKFVAQQVYGQPPHHSYVFGGSGGGRRSPQCLEYGPDAWDGAMPFMGGGDVVDHGDLRPIKGAQAISFATMFNVQRILASKLDQVVDATAAGGSGDPFAGLTTHEREQLAELYRLGYPRGDEWMIGEQMGQMWLWTATADLLYAQEPDYFDNFWTKPGYIGHDFPELVSADLIDTTVTVQRVLTATEVMDDPTFNAPEYGSVRNLAMLMATGAAGGNEALRQFVVLDGIDRGYKLGAGLRVASGAAKGRQLWTMQVGGNLFLADGVFEANLLRFDGVLPGDEIHVDNRRFLAYCYYARHHAHEDPQFDQFRVDGVPIYAQHPLPDLSVLMGVGYSGQYKGKLMWVHHTHDASLWPASGMNYRTAVMRSQGEAGMRDRFRQRWIENAEHVPPAALPSKAGRATNTWLVDYLPHVEQSLADLVAWVEQGVDPAETAFDYTDGKVTLPSTAAERGGIQAVVHATVNGARRAEVRTGEPVTLAVEAETPKSGGTIVSVEWDFDGSGTFPFKHPDIDGTATSVSLSTTHTYDRPGVFFATALVHSHRDGNVNATSRRIPNLCQVRVVVS
ncbi:MAG: hypothetical protein JWL70_757 [Acidimicrobiia bacterium]|nr:hypothetical protein [Acidimicrobiia bacterium]